jgi:hypothetical protein
VIIARRWRGRVLAVGAVLVCALAASAAQSGGPPGPSDVQLKDTLMTIERQFCQAVKERDAATITRLMGPDGVYVNSGGLYHDTQAFIEAIRRYQWEPVFQSRVELRRFAPDVAVLLYDMKLRPETDTYAITAVYVRRGERWVGVYHHGAIPRRPAAAPPPPQ